MAATRRAYTGAAVSTTTASSIAASGTTSFTITAYTGWPYGSDPFYVVVEPGTASEEKILVTRTGSTDTTINVASDSERGQDGTSAVSHSTGSTVFPVFTSVDADEANAVASVISVDTTNNRVGIGTATPEGSISVDSSNRQWSVTNDSTNYVTTKAHAADNASSLVFHRQSASRHHFSLDGATDAMLIDSSGNVGINDSTPSYKLDVTGDINATGDVRIAGTAIGAWQNFPAATGFTGITEGNGNLLQRYCVVNEMVFFSATFELGSTSAVSTGTFSVPVTMNEADSALHFTASFVSGSTGYAGMVRQSSGTAFLIRALAASGTYVTQAIISSTVPFTWTTGDRMAVSGFYEKA